MVINPPKLSEVCRLFRNRCFSLWGTPLSGARPWVLIVKTRLLLLKKWVASVANSSAIIIAEYRGLSVEAVTKLRANARKNNVTLRVVKNTLVRRAIEGTGFAGLADQCVGPLIYGFSADPVAAAKVLVISPRTMNSSF